LASGLEQGLLDGVRPSAFPFNIFEGYLTKPEMAKAIKRGVRTLDNWHRNHVGPPRTQFGGIILYNIEAFKTWLAAQSLRAGERAKPPGQTYFLAKQRQQQKRGPGKLTQRQKRPRGRPRKQPPPTAAAE
jgi:hypothetical protein